MVFQRERRVNSNRINLAVFHTQGGLFPHIRFRESARTPACGGVFLQRLWDLSGNHSYNQINLAVIFHASDESRNLFTQIVNVNTIHRNFHYDPLKSRGIETENPSRRLVSGEERGFLSICRCLYRNYLCRPACLYRQACLCRPACLCHPACLCRPACLYQRSSRRCHPRCR